MELSTLLLPFATAFGLALLHSLWIGAVLYAGVRALFPLLTTPARRHQLAYGALLALTAAFGFTLWYVYDPAPVCENLLAGRQPLDGLHLLSAAQTAANLSWTEWLQKELPAVAPWLSLVYLAGLLPAIFLLVRDHDRAMNLQRGGLSALPYSWADHLGDELSRHPATRRVQCFLSDRVGEVMTLGFWSPVIVFPVALVNELTPEMAHTILLHEIAHLRNYDHWLNYPQQFIRAFFFFHPAVHALCHLIDREREHRCDDWVAARCDDRRTYASALVTVARTSHIPPNNLVMSATKTPFSNRIQRLFLGEDNRPDGNFAFSVLLVVLLGAAHLGYTNLGADAGADNCLEEQAKTKTAALAPASLLLLTEPRPITSPYQLSKRNTATWVVTTPPVVVKSTDCQPLPPLPYIAAPEPPESNNIRALEQYERARLKYEEMQERTTQLRTTVTSKACKPAVGAVSVTKLPIVTGEATSALRITQNRAAVIQVARLRDTLPPDIRPIDNSDRTTLHIDASGGKSTSYSSGIRFGRNDQQIAYFLDGKRLEEGIPADLDPEQIQGIDVIKGEDKLAEMGLSGYKGAIQITSKKGVQHKQPSATGALKINPNGTEKTEITDNRNLAYLIDGKEVDFATFNTLDPASIKSVNVIKGAKQAEEAGYPGKEGIIEITTKE